MLYSLVETAMANGLEPYAYLRRLFEQLPYAKTVADYEALLPAPTSATSPVHIMGNTWIVDLRHYLTPTGATAPMPSRARLPAEYFASIVVNATTNLDDPPPLRRRRRPGHRRCSGIIFVVPSIDEDASGIAPSATTTVLSADGKASRHYSLAITPGRHSLLKLNQSVCLLLLRQGVRRPFRLPVAGLGPEFANCTSVLETACVIAAAGSTGCGTGSAVSGSGS